MSFVDRTLSNGLRVVIEPMSSVTSAACGFMARTGSRDETPPQAGISHFLEHMCFKGTSKRTWEEITVGFDDIGSTYNAFTSKERTFYFGWVRKNDINMQLDLIADMMRSTLPVDEFNTEKKVILEEIAMSHDQLEHHVYDLIHEKAFAGHPLSWPVLGSAQSVGDMTRDDMWAYLTGRYHPRNVILVVAGNVNPDEVCAAAEKSSAGWTAAAPRPERKSAARCPTGVATMSLERFKQQAVCWCYPAPGATDPKNEAANALCSILGGANSRFYWDIIQAGVAPVAGAWRVDYCDCGLTVLFGFCEPERADSLSDALRREAERITRDGVKEHELQRVKNRRRTSLVIEAESPYYRLSQLADDVDTYGRPRSVQERMEEVERLTTRDISACIEQWPITGDGLLVSVGPRAWPSK